jgi:hypothetical protein
VASKSLAEWLKMLWGNENEYVVCGVESLFVVRLSVPAAGGSPPLL